jgi:hypothetical protein
LTDIGKSISNLHPGLIYLVVGIAPLNRTFRVRYPPAFAMGLAGSLLAMNRAGSFPEIDRSQAHYAVRTPKEETELTFFLACLFPRIMMFFLGLLLAWFVYA